jgi:hypothetical protein
MGETHVLSQTCSNVKVNQSCWKGMVRKGNGSSKNSSMVLMLPMREFPVYRIAREGIIESI